MTSRFCSPAKQSLGPAALVGFVKDPDTNQPMIGAKVELVTPHCDPTINLHDFIHCVRGQTLVDIWPVDARGSL